MTCRLIIPPRAREYELEMDQLIRAPIAAFLVGVFLDGALVESCQENGNPGIAHLIAILIAEALQELQI